MARGPENKTQKKPAQKQLLARFALGSFFARISLLSPCLKFLFKKFLLIFILFKKKKQHTSQSEEGIEANCKAF